MQRSLTLTFVLVLTAAAPAVTFGQTAAERPTISGELTADQVVTANDEKMSCEQMRTEIAALAPIIQQRTEVNDQAQLATIDFKASEQLAAANRAKSDAQARAVMALIQARTKIPPLDMNNLRRVEKPVSEAFKPATEAGPTPTQMRQYHLAHLAFGKGC